MTNREHSIFRLAFVLLLASPLRAEPGSSIELAELVRSSEQIVLGHIERVVALERLPSNVNQPEDCLPRHQKRWQGMSAISIAELKVERTFKGRGSATSLWFVAGDRTGGNGRPAAGGDHLLLFLGEHVHFGGEGHEFNQRILELTRDYTVFGVLSHGSMTVSDGNTSSVRCPLELILPIKLRGAATVDPHGSDISWNAFEAVMKDAVARQMPIVRAFGFTDDEYRADFELRVYGDRRCVVRFTSPSRVTNKSFDARPEWFEWLAKKIESEHFFDLPDRIGEDHPDDMDVEWIDVTGLERTKSVVFHVPPPRFRTPAQDAALQRPLSLMTALRNLATDPKAVDPNGRSPVSSESSR